MTDATHDLIEGDTGKTMCGLLMRHLIDCAGCLAAIRALYAEVRVLREENDRLRAEKARQIATIRWYRERFGDTGQGGSSTDTAFRRAEGAADPPTRRGNCFNDG